MKKALKLHLFLSVAHVGAEQISLLQTRATVAIPGGPEEGALLSRSPLEEEWPEFAANLLRRPPAQSARPVVELLEQLAIPIAALALGGVIRFALPERKLPSQLLLFFGAQCFMNTYMKAILSNSVVSAELHMRGFQAPLILTALQQFVGFLVLVMLVLASQFTPWPYKPQRLNGLNQYITLAVLAICFTLNIALNNFSLSLLDMSVNVMIRSASPMTSLLLQLVFRRWFAHQGVDLRPEKLLLMCLGVTFALVVVFSKQPHGVQSAKAHSDFLGLALCCSSLVFSSMELIVVVMLGKGFKMNSIDTLLYMAVPVFLLLLLPSFTVKHPVAYAGHGSSTDWHVLVEVARLNPSTVVLVLLSGVFALGYNLLLYTVVRDLSPYFASFAANFNKIAAIGLSLLLGFEHLPYGRWGAVMIFAVLGNMISFTLYSVWPKRGPEAMKVKFAKNAAQTA